MTRVTLIAALGRNRVIGVDGRMPWHIPGDFAHFKATTLGHPLVLGRTTFESIGRPLPGRRSIVVTSDPTWAHDGVLVARSVEQALRIARELDPEVVHVGGGARVYAAAYDVADEQVLTEVDLEPEGDVHYPQFPAGEWVETRREAFDGYERVWLERMDPAA